MRTGNMSRKLEDCVWSLGSMRERFVEIGRRVRVQRREWREWLRKDCIRVDQGIRARLCRGDQAQRSPMSEPVIASWADQIFWKNFVRRSWRFSIRWIRKYGASRVGRDISTTTVIKRRRAMAGVQQPFELICVHLPVGRTRYAESITIFTILRVSLSCPRSSKWIWRDPESSQRFRGDVVGLRW